MQRLRKRIQSHAIGNPAASPNGFARPIADNAFHKDAQRSQRSPTCTLPTLLPAVIDQPKPENAPRATPEPSGDFDWNDTDSVVLTEQPETAVYWNPNGDLVIRQRRWPDDDVFVVITESWVDCSTS